MELKVGLVCDRGLNPKRPVNQDRFLAIANRGVFAVFDGVGGQRAGEVASQTAADTIEEALEHSSGNFSSEIIDRAIQFANRDILELAESDAAYQTMATTVALIHIQGDLATVAHVGDSRVYRLEDGRFYRETIDHTDTTDLRDGMGEHRSERKPHSNVITRALGVESQVEVEIKSIPLRDGARFLLCSDGIYKHIPDEEIARVLSQNEEPQGAADELKRIVYQRGADDNLTAVVVQVGRGMPNTNRDGGSSRARANRIEVEFGGGRRLDREPRASDSMRKLMYILIVLVLIAGAFYTGLRASGLATNGVPQRVDAPSSDPLSAGIEEFHKGRYREAGTLFASVTARAPQNQEAWYWLGRSQLELGEYESAAANLDRAGLEMFEANLYGAAAYRAAGNKARAEALLERYNEELRRRQRKDQQ
jgi:serine/threonine protein phosphatase PrpC